MLVRTMLSNKNRTKKLKQLHHMTKIILRLVPAINLYLTIWSGGFTNARGGCSLCYMVEIKAQCQMKTQLQDQHVRLPPTKLIIGLENRKSFVGHDCEERVNTGWHYACSWTEGGGEQFLQTSRCISGSPTSSQSANGYSLFYLGY